MIRSNIVKAFFLFLIYFAIFVALNFEVEFQKLQYQKLQYLQESGDKNPASSSTQIPIVPTTIVSTNSPAIDDYEIIVLSHLGPMESQLIFDSKA